jgi:hypothetical protein
MRASFRLFYVGGVTTALLLAAGCGGNKHHLADYNFTNRSMASISIAQPSPGLRTVGYDLDRGEGLTEAMIRAGMGAAKDVEARRARSRLDSASGRTDLTYELARRALGRTSRYLGLRPVSSADEADFLLEIHMHSYGLDARSSSAAYLYTNAEAVLLDRRTGREIWNVNVHGTDRLTPRVQGAAGIPGTIITAGTLHTLTVGDFQDALDQLLTLSSNLIADELRVSLRDVRRR